MLQVGGTRFGFQLNQFNFFKTKIWECWNVEKQGLELDQKV